MSKPTAWKHDNSLQQCRWKIKHRPAQILAGQLPHAIELLLHFFSPLQLLRSSWGKLTARRCANVQPPRLRRGHRCRKKHEKATPRTSTRSTKFFTREQKEERRLLDLHRSQCLTLLTERAQPVWEEGGSGFTSLLYAARRRLTCDTSAQKIPRAF